MKQNRMNLTLVYLPHRIQVPTQNVLNKSQRHKSLFVSWNSPETLALASFDMGATIAASKYGMETIASDGRL